MVEVDRNLLHSSLFLHKWQIHHHFPLQEDFLEGNSFSLGAWRPVQALEKMKVRNFVDPIRILIKFTIPRVCLCATAFWCIIFAYWFLSCWMRNSLQWNMFDQFYEIGKKQKRKEKKKLGEPLKKPNLFSVEIEGIMFSWNQNCGMC